MLTPEWYEACTDQILILYSRLEDDILKDIVRRILKTSMVTDSAKWQAEMLEEAGLLYNDIIQKIAKYTPQTADELRLLFEDAGTEVMKNDNIIAESATGKELHLSDSKLKILKANYRNTLGNLRNLTNTTAMTSQAAFIAACNDAHMQITSGAFSYQEAVRNAIRRAAQGGLTVKYPTGHIDKLDVAIRRAALTGVGQTAAKISIMNAEEMDCDLMEITAHAGARPEHAKWQGKLVSRTGKNVGRIVDGVRVLSLADIGYGTGAGFRGWNCRHDWHPYFEGYSTLNYTDEELAKLDEKNIEYDGQMYSQYEISQMQRAQERKIRELKRQTVKMQDAADFATDPKLKELAKADHQAMSVKLKTAERELKDFCKATGQDRDKFREQVLGFGRNEAQRAVWANKKHYAGLTSDKNSGIIKLRNPLRIDMQFFAKIPEEKFTKYALDPVKQPDKAKAFKEALGYTLENYQKLIKNIKNNVNESKFVIKSSDKYGTRYEQVMRLTGENGKQANVCTGWIKENENSEARLTSAYVTKKKVIKDEN